MKATPLAYIELSKENLVHNIKQFKKFTKKGTQFSVAIKGNAYGHGQNAIAKMAEPHVDYFQVDSLEELKLLRKVTTKKILVLGYVQKSDLAEAVKLKSVMSVFSMEQLKTIGALTDRLKIKQVIHLSVDAHLGREGFLPKALPEVFSEIEKYKFIKLSGIYAHFANIEDTTSFVHARKQIEEYEQSLALARKYGFTNLVTHISATSGILAYEKNKGIHPLVRLGIGLYGMWPSPELKVLHKNKISLKPVLQWKTKIAQIKILPKDRTIGYGLTYKTRRRTKIALIPQGYADGFDRGFSNKGQVLIKGKRCKVLGRVMMNMIVVDVTKLSPVKLEDEVVILGKQGRTEISAEELAKLIGTINYEITTRISALLPRILA